METFIVAIAQTNDREALNKMLALCAHLETGRLKIFKNDSAQAADRLRVAGTHVWRTSGAVGGGSHGTSVPGMRTTLTLSPYPMSAQNESRLTDMGMSSDAAHHYNIAVEEGRSVVTYRALAENADSVETQFRACGFVKVRRFDAPLTCPLPT